jgi:hypothetical protein
VVTLPDRTQSWIERMVTRYTESPLTRALFQLVPWGGSSIDTYLSAKTAELHQERAREFFDELSRGTTELTEEAIANEDYLHAFFITTKAALNTRRKRKIRLFARFLTGYYIGQLFETVDGYEEYLSILDEMSVREIHILSLLHPYEIAAPGEMTGGNAVYYSTWWNEHWIEFIGLVMEKTGIQWDELPTVFTRLLRTGLYRQRGWGVNPIEVPVGGLAPQFDKLRSAIVPPEAPRVL